MRARRCEFPVGPIPVSIVFIGRFDTVLTQSQSMPNGSREIQQGMPEPSAEGTSHSTISRCSFCRAVFVFHSLVHRSGMMSGPSPLNSGPVQVFGAITVPPFKSAPSHAPHQLYELLAMI